MTDLPRPRRLRADAARNRDQILRAAVDLLVEVGPTVALEAVAKRAGVSTATLYRHFPDRAVLLRHVAVDLLEQSATAAQVEEADAFTALAAYLHTAIDLRMGVIMPMLADVIAGDDQLFAARDEARRSLAALVRAAHDEGSLRPDVGPGDIGLLVIRLAQPLPVPIVAAANHRLSHRHAELVLDGLLRFLAVDSLRDRPLALDELDPVPSDGDEPVWVDPRGYWGEPGVTPAADSEDRSRRTGS
ncbi:TetR/AcrR family transcriptional regulator [Actinophytocola oryzae]|uniref:TetR family transcriptional regulator n=1 Tax=Actinophytocola oryzae TaxID=502181 RepID=A0A4R7UUV9_9PSEU|nr:TetR/AcrR family transcriptional regulator [Actinophytocola oryzae]TDV39804.1 TetR family transcriptional regulator [Actinophytocola oryzae]